MSSAVTRGAASKSVTSLSRRDTSAFAFFSEASVSASFPCSSSSFALACSSSASSNFLHLCAWAIEVVASLNCASTFSTEARAFFEPSQVCAVGLIACSALQQWESELLVGLSNSYIVQLQLDMSRQYFLALNILPRRMIRSYISFHLPAGCLWCRLLP